MRRINVLKGESNNFKEVLIVAHRVELIGLEFSC